VNPADLEKLEKMQRVMDELVKSNQLMAEMGNGLNSKNMPQGELEQSPTEKNLVSSVNNKINRLNEQN